MSHSENLNPKPTLSQGVETEGGHDEVGDKDQGKRLEVWDQFHIVTLPSGVIKNKSNHCRALMSFQEGGITSQLMRHLKLHCPFKDMIFLKQKDQAAGSLSTKSKTIQSHMQAAVTSEGAGSVLARLDLKMNRDVLHVPICQFLASSWVSSDLLTTDSEHLAAVDFSGDVLAVGNGC